MSLKLLLSLFCIVWRLSSAEEYTNHWLTTDAAALEFCSHDSFLNGSCQCNVDYNGNFCLQRKCRNFGVNLNQGIDGNGFVGVQDRCVCPPGFLGRNCEPVSCVEGAQQVYSSLTSERTISILASYNSRMVESWSTGDIGSIICNYTGYGRNFNYNFQNAERQFPSSESVDSCISSVKTYLDADTCMSEDTTPAPIPCEELNIDNLNTLVQKSLPNSIIFVVTNMKVPDAQINGPQTENIIATAIARRIQINVVVYNNTQTSLLASDPSLAYLQNIATATFGTFVLPSLKFDNAQYDVVRTLLNNWSNDIGVAQVFTDGMTLPVDPSSDIYIAAQTYYNEDLNINSDSMTTVSQTDFWKLYKIEAGNFHPLLSISNLMDGTKAYVYSSGRIKAYSAFTSDPEASISIADASYSVSVLGASYYLVLRLESSSGVLHAADIGRTFGTVDNFEIGKSANSRYGCQFAISFEAKCTSIGASSITLITSDNKNSVTFPIYCASLKYGTNIYNNAIRETVEITHLPFAQSFAQEFSCGAEVAPEVYKQRSFVIIADNTEDNLTLSSVDNVFRGKDSVFLHLTDYVNRNTFHYSHYFATFTDQNSFITTQALDYGIFLTKVMNQTFTSATYADAGNVSVTDRLITTIQSTNQYSDILFIVNYDVLVESDKIQTIKQQLAEKRSRLYVLFVQVYKPTTDDAYRFLTDFAVASGGVAVRLTSYDDLHAFFDVYFANLVANDIVAKAFSENQKPGIALNNVYLATGDYYLMLTNDDLSDNGPVNATISVDGLDVKQVAPIIGELQVFQITVANSGLYDIPVRFSGLSQLGNVVLLTNSDNLDFVSLSFLDQNNKNRYDLVYGEGKFIPFLYSTAPFTTNSTLSIFYSDSINPAKLIFNGPIIQNPSDCAFKDFKYYVNYPWTCPQSGGLYHLKVDWFSDGVTTVSRTFPITCLGASFDGCLNGGTRSGDVCVCPLQWTGPNCATPVCLNNGTATSADTCDCLGSFFGDFCESSIVNCIPPSSPVPDYRSDLSSLIIVADAQALAFSSLTNGLPITGTAITVILYGDGNAPRVVQSTTNGQRLPETLKAADSLPTPAPDAVNDMYNALNFALDVQFTSRALIVLYTSNPDDDVDKDVLIRLAAKRAEIRVVTTSQTTPYSANFKTISLIGNSIPTVVQNPEDFEKYLTSYVAPIFSALQYQKSVTAPQRVFNVFQTGSFVLGTTVTIPADTTFTNAKATAFVQVNGGRYKGRTDGVAVGSSTIYNGVDYDQKDGITITFEPFNTRENGTYSIEVLNYLKTSYGFSNLTNGGNEQLVSGLASGQPNVLSVYSSPFSDVATSNPVNFPFLSISEIQADGTLSNATTLLFTRKNESSCFFKHFTVLDVCSASSTIGYQVQLTTRSNALENRQQQFVWTCHKTTYQNHNTTCYGKGSPMDICSCDPGYEGIDCQTPQCEHGGVSDGWFCRCPIPYYGRRCEIGPDPIPTTTPGTPVTSTSAAASTTILPTSTVQPTTGTTLTPQTTTVPKEVRAVAFVIDTIGLDDYAYNQSTQSIVEYIKAFNNVHYVMLVGNYDPQTPFGFQQYDSVDALSTRLALFWNIRKSQADSKIANLSKSLDSIQNSYTAKEDVLSTSKSNNVFYLTQIGLSADDNPSATDVPSFDKSSLVYSKFSQNADQATLDTLKKFSPTVTNVRDYYNGVKTMVASTKLNESAVLPQKPNRKCTFGLQTNVMVAIDRSMPKSNQIAENLNAFLPKFREGFNYIDNDENRCGVTVTPLPDFYNERTAITAFAYYSSVARSTGFCPSQYNTYLGFSINGTDVPTFIDKQVKAMGKYINSADCSCNRYDDAHTLKLAIWLPRGKAPVSDTYRNYLKYNTTNAYHFVVPFYDINDDKDNDLFYQILVDQDNTKPDYYLLPNAATNSIDTIIDLLHEKICETAGVDPTAIPPEMSKMHFDSRHDSFNNFWKLETEE